MNADELIQFESEVAELIKEGKNTCPVHLCGGNEEFLICLFKSIREQDWVFASHRNHYHYLLKGGNPQALKDEIQGLETGFCGGRAGSMHYILPDLRFYSSAIIGGAAAIACGVAYTIKKEFGSMKDRPMVWCFMGDGGEDSGHFAEALRFSVCRSLPLTFVIEDNDQATESSKAVRWHNYKGLDGPNVIRYEYKLTWPHVGIKMEGSL